ncbi:MULTISPECIES: hypothetical protein [Paenibacillus]|uniref:hypothetical protein n=1 Tax=Paenibacillus TaxID=44249 RepID=UPI00037BD2A4|nr:MULTISPECIES: hypothetical protein [Paenibacillus]
MIAYLIVACEVLFWVFVIGGLAARYVLGAKRLSTFLLICTPLIDLVLLIAAFMDLRNGATATMAHGIAAVYIGVSLAYGHRMIRWADERFAYRFADGQKPQKLYGREHARHERTGWMMHLISWIVGNALLLFMIWYVDDASRTVVLNSVIRVWAIVLAIDFVISFSYTLWPRKQKSTA